MKHKTDGKEYKKLLTRPASVLENDIIRDLQQRVQAIPRKLPGKQIRVTRIRLPETVNQVGRDLGHRVCPRVPVDAIRPVNPSERVMATPVRILHGQKGRKVMLFRVTRIDVEARQLELPPEPPISDHHQGVLSLKDEELRPDSEPIEGDLRHHRVLAAGRVPVPQLWLAGEDLDVTGWLLELKGKRTFEKLEKNNEFFL